MSDKATSRNLDFTNVREVSGINPVRMEEGDYLATVKAVNEKESKKTGNAMWEFVIGLNDRQTATYGYYCVLDAEQLWKIRNLLIAAGITVPKKRLKVDPNKVVGKTIAVTLEDDEYEGKEKSTIAAIFPAAELAPVKVEPEDDEDEDEDVEVEEEEEAPVEKPKRKRKPKPDPEPEPEDDEEEEEEVEKPKRKRKPKAKKEPEPEEDDEIDLDDLDDLDD